ncbi:MAG TPA: hypothetical protein DCG54_09735 [Anaerolineae bacterium]|jgi:hypothetical protein|nr:hypothetical protein [Anaerolineae bacterium]
MANATLSTKGLDKYLEQVAEVEALFPENVGESLLDGADVVLGEMQEIVRQRTGNLHDHLKIKGPTNEGTFIFVEIGLIQDSTNEETRRYGMVIEFGSSSVRPESYIRAGTEKSKAAWRKAVISALQSKTGLEFK